jgi:hypothetical protein
MFNPSQRIAFQYCVLLLCGLLICCVCRFLPRIHWVDSITHYLVIVCYIMRLGERTVLLKCNCKYCLRYLGRYNSFVIVHKYITTGLLMEFSSLIFCEQNNEVRQELRSWSKLTLI